MAGTNTLGIDPSYRITPYQMQYDTMVGTNLFGNNWMNPDGLASWFKDYVTDINPNMYGGDVAKYLQNTPNTSSFTPIDVSNIYPTTPTGSAQLPVVPGSDGYLQPAPVQDVSSSVKIPTPDAASYFTPMEGTNLLQGADGKIYNPKTNSWVDPEGPGWFSENKDMLSGVYGLGQLGLGIASYMQMKPLYEKQLALLDQQLESNAAAEKRRGDMITGLETIR